MDVPRMEGKNMTSETLSSLIGLFFAGLTSGETRYTQALAYAQAIIKLDYQDRTVEETDYLDKAQKKVDFLKENTSKKVKTPLAVCEFVIIRDKGHSRSLGVTLDVYGKELQLYDILVSLAEAHAELISLVSEIAMRNNVGVVFDLSQYKTGAEEKRMEEGMGFRRGK
jgi:hypothetical protein